MNNQDQTPTQRQFYELDELYYTASLADYKNALQLAIKQLEQALPGFTIAFAEIYTTGGERQAHGGMCHVLMPIERSK
jgi:hypothetical protein